MAQTSGDLPRVGRFALRTVALIVGLIGALLALALITLYALVHILARVTGVPDDSAHFFYGVVVLLVGTAGAFLAPILPILAAMLLVLAGIALFFVVGWWAFLASPFFLVAAALTFSHRRVDIPGMA